MTIEEMKARKRELGYSNKTLAKEAGVPLGTVQKIFSGETKSPRMDTITALTRVLIIGEKAYDPISETRRLPETHRLPEMHRSPKTLGEPSAPYGAEAAQDPESFPGKFTIDDYYALPDDRRAELIDGKFYDMSGPSFRHQGIIGEVFYQMKTCLKKSGKKCRVFVAPCDVQLDQNAYTMVQPDLQVICDDKDLHRYVYFGAPDFVMEVLSKSTRSHDLITKLYKYKNAGVREYWIVDPESEQVMVYVFEKNDLPIIYPHNGKIPVYISGGGCVIDFEEIFDEVRDLPDDE